MMFDDEAKYLVAWMLNLGLEAKIKRSGQELTKVKIIAWGENKNEWPSWAGHSCRAMEQKGYLVDINDRFRLSNRALDELVSYTNKGETDD